MSNDQTQRDRLDVETLLREARQATGLSEFGDQRFIEPLTRWIESCLTEGGLTDSGVELLRANIVRLLTNRLRMSDDIGRHPEILSEDVSDPIIVVGLTRTGTTKLQRLIAQEPAVQSLPFWQLQNPAPIPGHRSGEPDPRIAATDENLAMVAQHFPALMAGHPSETMEADEELFVMESTFEALTFLRVRVPSFLTWLADQPRDFLYEDLRRWLQYLQWQNGGRTGPYVLKSPVHLGHLDMLAKTFPNATVAHCHRHPRVAIASTVGLYEIFRLMATDHVDQPELAKEVLGFWSEAMNRTLDQRAALGTDLRVVDVSYDDILHDPLQAVAGVLHAHGIEISGEGQANMSDWMGRNPINRHGRHSYSTDAYGLNDGRIDQAFDRYLEQFGPLLQPSASAPSR